MVHGGLRYLMLGNWRLTRTSVRERERLLSEAPGLVDPLGFLFGAYRRRIPGHWSFSLLLTVYDLFAGRRTHAYYPAHDFKLLAPHIRAEGLKGGARCIDAVTDDARLVFRVIREAERDGALALNYARAEALLKQGGRVRGVSVRDALTGKTAEVRARAVVNATGAWADRLRKQVGGPEEIRPLRGSHLVFPFWRIPVAQAVALLHPEDRRAVFITPWDCVTVVGTTDLDHEEGIDSEARIAPEEIAYLLEAVQDRFPSLGITRGDILSTYAGIRPVISGGALDPSREKRDHKIWEENGLVSVSGGKLTTFRFIALDVLRHAAPFLPSLSPQDTGKPVFRAPQAPEGGRLDHFARRRLLGRFGADAVGVVNAAEDGELSRIPCTDTLWAELRWAARRESVAHLEDLLLRRTRLGLLLPQGAAGLSDRIRTLCREELGWDENQWQREWDSYRALWQNHYSLPK
jgi:glycerol-3-phosphate dehydrogenase